MRWETVRIAGYAYQKGFGGHFHNDNAVGALRDIPGLVIASLSGAVPRQGMTRKDMDRLCDLVKTAADNVSRKMGALISRRPEP